MRKRFIFIGGIIVTVILIIYFFIPVKIAGMITHYDPFTFEMVLNYDSMRANYGIGTHNSPIDFGYQVVEEINTRSVFDHKNLNAWYVPSSVSKKCIVMVHGRASNRLKTMKYLELFKEKKIDTLYNIFIPDLRNSGKSEASETFMGYKFAEDLAAYLLFLKNEKKQDTFLLYGFSMGTMAILTMLDRPDLKDTLQLSEITIEKLIFDSPLSNVKETLRKNSNNMGLPNLLFERAYHDFNNQIQGYADNMRLSYLLQSNTLPVLFLMSKTDESTFYSIFKDEARTIGNNSTHIVEFDSVGHVKIYQDPRYKAQYADIVSEFIIK